MEKDNGWAGTTLRIAEDGKYQMLDAIIDLGDEIRIEMRIEVEHGTLKASIRSLLPLSIVKDGRPICVGQKQGAWVKVPGGWAIQSNKQLISPPKHLTAKG